MNDIGWIFIYIGSFGFSEFVVKNFFLDNKIIIILYYTLLLSLGFWILHKTKHNKLFKNLKLKKNSNTEKSDLTLNNEKNYNYFSQHI